MAHALMEAAVETHVGVAPRERTATRTGQRNRSEGCAPAVHSGTAWRWLLQSKWRPTCGLDPRATHLLARSPVSPR